jgi:uncharacterized membrane protein
MKKIFLAGLLFILLANCVSAATISGTTFEWYSLEPLKNVIVDINTIPEQTLVATDGTYSLNIAEPGTYIIKAQYFENNSLKYVAEETVKVASDGNFKLDLILLPALENDQSLFNDLPDLNVVSIEPVNDKPKQPDLTIIFVAVIAAALLAYFIFFRKPKKPAQESKMQKIAEKDFVMPVKSSVSTSEKPVNPLGTSQKEKSASEKELDEVIEIIKRYGGRATQKDLREKLPYGEAKVSLIVAELEHLGKIKKFKKGRGNIIVLNM